VVLFVDANANGKFDEGEAKAEGTTVTVTDSEGTALSGEENADLGLLFSDLTAGAFTVVVADAAGHSLGQVDLTVAADAHEGQLLYVPIAAE
jgi:SdrD B-like domain